jgi:uncharacterized protein
MAADLDGKYRHLQQTLTAMGSALLAFSGGVDSTLLLQVCQEALPDKFLAVTASSETMPRHELMEAVQLSEMIGARHLIIESDEMEDFEFTNNPADKCYICKKRRFESLAALAEQQKLQYLLDGSNKDDLEDYRPGMRALQELGVRSPLCEVGLSKTEIRQLSQKLGLPTWDKPSYACLASRIPFGSQITREKLRQVDAGEDFLRGLGLNRQVRVRHCGDTARLEVMAPDLGKFFQEEVRRQVISFFKEIGFIFVTLDLEGYRMGSLNQAVL